MKSSIYYASVLDMPTTRHEHRHATNVIHDAFGPADGMPFVAVVDRLPQVCTPSSAHKHRGFNELIVMLRGQVTLWCGASVEEMRPYPLKTAAMFLIPAESCHVFVNGTQPAQWMIMFVPVEGAPHVDSREEISRLFTERDIPIPDALKVEIDQCVKALSPDT
jgi:hypothetical protein